MRYSIVLVVVACSLWAADARATEATESLDHRTATVVRHLRGCVSTVTRIRQLVDLNVPDAELSRAAWRAGAVCDGHATAIGRTSTNGFRQQALTARAAIDYWERGLDHLSRLADHSEAQDPIDATELVEDWRTARSRSLKALTGINEVRKLHALSPLKPLVIAVIAG